MTCSHPHPVAGVDVGKSFLDLGFEPAAKPLRVRNDARRHRGADRGAAPARRRRVALEAIGPYAWP